MILIGSLKNLIMTDKNIKGDQVRIIDGRFESVYLHESEIMLKALNEVSPSFCLAKWYNVSIHIPTGQTHSCYHPKSHHIPLEEIKINVSALHNTKYKKEQRKKMIEGERPEECNFCWEIEDSGDNLSDRPYRSLDSWSRGLIRQAIAIGHEGNPNPRYVEVNFNQACNFRCTYCSPHLSTAWQQDIERNGPYKLSDRHHNDLVWMKDKSMPNNSPDNPYLLALWQWLPKIYQTLKTFRMTGGEPLMDKNTFRMFDYIKNNPKHDLHLAITSNCCPPGDQWSKFINELNGVESSIDHFMLYCSLDSWGEQAEYIRDGLNFEILVKNIREYLSKGTKHSLNFIVTFNVLSYPGWLTYVKNIHALRNEFNVDRQLIWFDIPQLSSPSWMDPRMCKEMISVLEESLDFMNSNIETDDNRFKGFKDFEISKIQRLIDWIKTTPFDDKTAMKNFYLYFSEHDKRRGTDFLKTFPELNNLWTLSKQSNE